MPSDEQEHHSYCPLQETHVIKKEHGCTNVHSGRKMNCPISPNHNRCPLNNKNEIGASNTPLWSAAEAA